MQRGNSYPVSGNYKICLLTILLLYKVTAFAQLTENPDRRIYSCTIHGDYQHRFLKAVYTLYIPNGRKQIRGILVHQHGCTMEGTGAPITTDLQYRAFAKKWGLAILAPDLFPHGRDCDEWNKPENGSEASFFAALDSLSRASGHKELKEVPWLLWGHSGGGHWVLSMLARYPERTIAVVAYSAAFNRIIDYETGARGVPVLLRHAGKGDINADWASCWNTAVKNFTVLRNQGGFAAIAPNAEQSHNYSYIRTISIPFFEAVLKQRLTSGKVSELNSMDTTQAWLGDTSIVNGKVGIFKQSRFAGNRLSMSWLPDSAFADKYREFLETGRVKDNTAPPPPYQAKMSSVKGGIEIRWRADADIESGIQCFNIYKNGLLLERYPLTGVFQDFSKDGDNPLPSVEPLMRCSITNALPLATDRISISTVNRDGLESLKTPVHMSLR